MAKINLIQAKNNSYYCDGIFAIGVYAAEGKAVLIDSGISKEGAKELDKALIEAGLEPAAIINTHCHGDHCGGNAFFQQKYPQIRIFGTQTEKPFIEDPLLAPICFCGGAAPYEELKKCRPITPQQPSRVTDVIAPYEDQTIEIGGTAFDIITLPGHTRGMIAVRTPDKVLYCGDALFGGETFNKHPLLYYTFIGEALDSFEKLKSLIPSIEQAIVYHGGPVEEIKALIEEHEKRLLQVKETLFSLLDGEGLTLEEITAKMMELHQVPDNLVAYHLTKTPMQAYVAELERERKIKIVVAQGVARIQQLKMEYF